jgi:hypothetical protein
MMWMKLSLPSKVSWLMTEKKTGSMHSILHQGCLEKTSENHVGYIISGLMAIRDAQGNECNLGPGDAFEVGPRHDALGCWQ